MADVEPEKGGEGWGTAGTRSEGDSESPEDTAWLVRGGGTLGGEEVPREGREVSCAGRRCLRKTHRTPSPLGPQPSGARLS